MIAEFINNPTKTWVAVLLVALFGSIAIFRMPMQLTPEVQTPTITIETRWPGASPQEVEREIVQEQEEQLKGVEGVVKMSSECMDSSGKITLEFEVGANMQEALLRVNSRLQQVQEYPEDAKEPVLQTANSADRPIAWFILEPRLPDLTDLEKFAAAHPELAAEVRQIRATENLGLGFLRLKELVERCRLYDELLPAGRDPASVTREEVEQFAAEHKVVRKELTAALAQPDLAAELRRFVPHAENYQEIASFMPDVEDIETLRKFAEDHIQARFERVRGVSTANTIGGRDPELQVVVDPVKLAARQLTITDVRNALRGQNKDTSGGDFWEGKRRYVIRTLGQYRSPEQVRDELLMVRDGQPVYVRDIADEVRVGYKKPDGVVRRYGISCIAINAIRATGANVLEVMGGLQAAMHEMNAGMLKSRGLELAQVYDETEYIYSSIGLVQSNIVVGGILTVLVLLLFLRSGKSTLVIALAIPTSIIGTFLLLNMMGRSLNVISLAGLAFAVGMLVDNAVVVLENIYRHYQHGAKPFDAAVRGTTEVWGAVAASTLTTLAVFIPVVLVKEEAGQLFLDIALAISCAVGLSMVVAMTLIPVATSQLFDEQSTDGSASTDTIFGSVWLGAFVTGLLRPLDAVANWMLDAIAGLNAWIMTHWTRRVATVALFVIGSVAATYAFWPKVEYLPNGNRNLVFGILLPPSGYNLNQMIAMGEQIEGDLREYWDHDPVAGPTDYPPIGDFFFVARGRMVILGVRAEDPMKAGKLVPLVMAVGSRIPGTITIANQSSLFEQGLAGGRAVNIEITGPELEHLVALGGRILGQVKNPMNPVIPGEVMARPIPSLDLSTPEIHVVARAVQGKASQMTNVDLGYTVDALVDGAYASDFYLDGDKIDLVIMGNADSVQTTQDVEALPIATPTGDLVPLGAIATVDLRSGPEQINRRERQRSITIEVTPPAEVPLEEAIERIRTQIVEPLRAEGALDGGYNITYGGTADKLGKTWTALRGNVLLAGLITYLLMAALFESWVYPFVIILTVPLGAVGGVMGLQLLGGYLWLFGEPPQNLDVLTMLGFVILIGTVVNNPILIIHQSLQYMQDDGMGYVEAIIESVRTRVRPIFMTTITTVLGLMPLVLFPGAGSELYRGLGAVVLFGLLVSTVLTLVLVPSLFSLFLDVFGVQRRPADRDPQNPARDEHGDRNGSPIRVDEEDEYVLRPVSLPK